MPELTEGKLTFDFGLVKLSGKLSEQDRQCAWQLYTEMVTRVAVTGKRRDETGSDFTGEVMAESLESLHSFFLEARQIMKSFPVGKIAEYNQKHLGIFIHDLLTDVLRPFLEKWRADYRVWWEQQKDSHDSLFEIQKRYPRYAELLAEWTQLRLQMRFLEARICGAYKLKTVGSLRAR
jgi:hypothetical protein